MKHVIFLLDVSGSMAPKKEEMVIATNNFLACMEKELSTEVVLVQIYTFNTKRTLLFEGLLSTSPRITSDQYKTDGGTSLFDCLGQTLNEVPNGGNFIIATDGDDNESKEYKTDSIRALG